MNTIQLGFLPLDNKDGLLFFPFSVTSFSFLSKRNLIKMTFTAHISTNILSMIIYGFSKKMGGVSTALLFPEPLPELPLEVLLLQYWFFLACTSNFFQPRPIIQFQSQFHILGICCSSIPFLSFGYHSKNIID